MESWDKRNQILINAPKNALNLPIAVPIFKLSYALDGQRRYVNVYPTLQFLYSHHVQAEYITAQVREDLKSFDEPSNFCARFFASVDTQDENAHNQADSTPDELDVTLLLNFIRQNPQYTIAALRQGVYVIGMKDQFNIHDLQSHPLC